MGEQGGKSIDQNQPAAGLFQIPVRLGDDFVLRLNGMFAFALWDARKRRLLIGRDRLGIKPLYVCHDERRVAFASEAKALLAVPGMRARLDPVALDAYLHLGYVPAPLSIFGGISKLPPATLLSVEGGRVWMIGIPERGDMARLEELCQSRGLSLEQVSWRR